jgi:DNA modification methylase
MKMWGGGRRDTLLVLSRGLYLLHGRHHHCNGAALMSVRIMNADVMDGLAQLPDESVHCVVTSPPYWGLRDYGVAGQLGLEPTLGEHIEAMVRVFREVRRVLRKDGTLWLNYGDCYITSAPGNKELRAGKSGNKGNRGADHQFRATAVNKFESKGGTGGVYSLKPKDMAGVPWRIAFALQDDGWWLRQDIIWSKPNPMPEPIKDRCTKAHEYLFLLAKSERYYFDAEAIAEPVSLGTIERMSQDVESQTGSLRAHDCTRTEPAGGVAGSIPWECSTRNKRSVWEIATHPFPEAHFATFPPALIEPCIKAGTSERGCCAKCGAPVLRQVEREANGGWQEKYTQEQNDWQFRKGHTRGARISGADNPAKVLSEAWVKSCKCEGNTIPCTVLDFFGGSGTTGLVADRLKRNAILIELNPTYAAMAERRIKGDCPMHSASTR